MTPRTEEFQPGAILHEVIVGAFRARGLTFEGWCKQNGMTTANGRNATFGQSRGKIGKANLERIIDAAGREFVAEAYRRRLADHYQSFGRAS
ncbi:hypothetical protein [Thioclava sp.]|uniref:hypothetical protein n=1 Tax=Thioclava sp. TaxID=1933450 RepID=UPI003241F3C4